MYVRTSGTDDDALLPYRDISSFIVRDEGSGFVVFFHTQMARFLTFCFVPLGTARRRNKEKCQKNRDKKSDFSRIIGIFGQESRLRIVLTFSIQI